MPPVLLALCVDLLSPRAGCQALDMADPSPVPALLPDKGSDDTHLLAAATQHGPVGHRIRPGRHPDWTGASSALVPPPSVHDMHFLAAVTSKVQVWQLASTGLVSAGVRACLCMYHSFKIAFLRACIPTLPLLHKLVHATPVPVAAVDCRHASQTRLSHRL